MSTHNICFCGEIRKLSLLFGRKNALSGDKLSKLLMLKPRTFYCKDGVFCLTLSTLGKIFSRRYIEIFFFFARKQYLTFHANCLHWRQFA